jgi:hypothetical protein
MRKFKVGDRVRYVDDTGDKTSHWSTTITLGKIYTIVKIKGDWGIKIKGSDLGYCTERFILANCILPQNIKVL